MSFWELYLLFGSFTMKSFSRVVTPQWWQTSELNHSLQIRIREPLKTALITGFWSCFVCFFIYNGHVRHPSIQAHCNIYFPGVSEDGKPHGKKLKLFIVRNDFVYSVSMCKHLLYRSLGYVTVCSFYFHQFSWLFLWQFEWVCVYLYTLEK